MSIVKTLDVFCDEDDCMAWTHGTVRGSAAQARRVARQAGWRRRRDGRDLCPLHAGVKHHWQPDGGCCLAPIDDPIHTRHGG